MKLSPGHHTLPRKKTLPLDAAGRTNNSSSSGSNVQQQQQQFQRGQPLRRSCLSPTQYHHQPQQQQQPSHHHQHRQQESSLHFEYFVPRSVSEFNLAAAVTDMAVPPPPPASVLRPSSAVTPPIVGGVIATNSQTRLLDGSGNTATRSREKMVTFEDEGINCGITSTPTRKPLPGLENVFM